MNCEKLNLKPWQRRACFIVGAGGGVVGMYTAWTHRDKISEGFSWVSDWFKKQFKKSQREPPKEIEWTDIQDRVIVRWEPPPLYVDVAAFGVGLLSTLGFYALVPVILVHDYKKFRDEKSCCRLIRGGISRSVFYPLWALGGAFMTEITYASGKDLHRRYKKKKEMEN